MSDVYDTFIEEKESLGKTLVETPTFNARVSHFWYHLSIIADELAEKRDVLPNIDDLLNSFIDVMKLMKNTLLKKCSKNELVDCIIKRPKIYEEFRRLESQLFGLADSTNFLKETKSILDGPIMQHFINEMDWQYNKRMLLAMACYVDCSKDFSLQEHVTTILTLIAYLNNQPTHQSCTIRLLSTTHLEESSYRLLYTLMDPISSNITKPDHHQQATRQTSIFSAFGYGSDTSHEVLADEHHTAVYTGTGQTYRAVWNGALVAVKKMSPSVFQGDAVGLREAATCLQANSRRIKSSPYLASLIAGSVDKDGFVYFVSPLAPLGCLYDTLTNTALDSVPFDQRVRLSPVNKMSILMDVINGINHLHAQGFVHGRLKDSNVLLYEGYRAKLSDFGVQTFYSNDTRLNLKGTRGVRWTPPEVYRLELDLEEAEKRAKVNRKTQPVCDVEEVSHRFPYPLTPSMDIYAVGLIVMVLLSEKMPYFNLPFEEGVKTAILDGITPGIGGAYPDSDKLSRLEPLMYQCIGKPEDRKPLTAGLLPLVEEIYCNLEYAHQEDLMSQRTAEIAEVQKEIKEIKVKVKDHVQLISKGRDLINKKDHDKILIHNAKDRKQAELDIDRARAKLKTFEEELTGLQEDLDGAEHDMGELFRLKSEIQTRLDFDKRHALQIRVWTDNFDQEELLCRYCTERERDRIGEMIASADSLEELIIDAHTEYSDSPLGVPNRMNPFLNVREGSTEVSSERRKEIENDIRDGTFEYQYLVDHLDTIFRVPLNPNLIPTQLKNIEAKQAAEGTRVKHYSMDEEDDYGAEYGYSLSARGSNAAATAGGNSFAVNKKPTASTVAAAVDNRASHSAHSSGSNSAHTTSTNAATAASTSAGTSNGRSVSTASVGTSVAPGPTAKPGTTVTYYGSSNGSASTTTAGKTIQQRQVEHRQQLEEQQQQTTTTLPALNPIHAVPTGPQPKTAFTAVSSQGLDSDEDADYDSDEEMVSFQRNYAERAEHNPRGADSDDESAMGTHESLYTPSMYYRPTDQLLHTEDDFPSTEDDIIHCQYLAASRGDWDEAVGMRRHGLGFTDLQIETFLEANETPAHIAASFGHLQVFRELIELGGVEHNAVNKDGNTPMHCACMRGHLVIVQYLMEVHSVSATELNNNKVTPVQMAATGGFVHVLRYLMEQSPQPVPAHFKDSVHGASLLHWACLNDSTSAIEYLLQELHVPVEYRAAADESSCILWASFGGSLKVVQFLIEQANADPKVKTNTGMTCLHMATASGSVEKTFYLCEVVRLSVTEKNNDHKSPFDLATGKCAIFLNERKARGFLVGSVVDKTRKIKQKHLKEK